MAIVFEDDDTVELDLVGKAVFDDIYNALDPRDYYLTLGRYNYIMPDSAHPVFERIYAGYRRLHGAGRLKIVDVGCSYGVNALLHKFGLAMSHMQAHYAAKDAEGLEANALLQVDRRFVRGRETRDDLTFVGIDTAENAVRYAMAMGALDAGLSIDLEDPEAANHPDAGVLAGADVVISTGAVGYVTDATFQRVLERSLGEPWLALFALRQFPIDDIAAMCRRRGYVIETLDETVFPQRRFVDHREAQGATDRLRAVGRKPSTLEQSGWLAAQFALARPRRDAEAQPLSTIIPPGA